MIIITRTKYKKCKIYKQFFTAWHKMIYELIYKNLLALKKSIKVANINIDSLDCIINAIKYDNPELFYIGNFRIQMSVSCKINEILPEYFYSEKAIQTLNNNISTIIDKLTDDIKKTTEWNKILFVHDWFCKNIQYQDIGQEAYTIIGALLYKKAVCEGIAKAAKYIFDYLNIDSYIISGRANSQKNANTMDNHAWNKVKVDGKWYNIDITFDNTLSNERIIRHDYFLLADNAIQCDHIDLSNSEIVCDDDKQNYYIKNGLIMVNQQMYVDYVKKMLGMRIYLFEMKLPNAQDPETVYKKVLSLTEKALKEVNEYRKISIDFNKWQLVFTICLEL